MCARVRWTQTLFPAARPVLAGVYPRLCCPPAPSSPLLKPRRAPLPPACLWWMRPGAGPPRRLPPSPAALPAVPARGGMAGVRQCLQQLHRCLQPGDAASAALHGYSLLRGLGESCLTSLGSAAQGGRRRGLGAVASVPWKEQM